ncbi:MAG: tetratricopeptide repeat protein [Bacteroidetes bacterium]|jgi:tetratricopeptide (TPR) repeat protein|nr:tetratricopeptide repeat protein [Bacteroidota bacterium]MCA6441851.1 tetratricopeptide repeat protein [Bacteroidota bacterium]
MRKLLYIVILVANYLNLFAQKPNNSNEKLALQYFENKEFDKANDYLSDLYANNPDNWYPYYFKSLMAVKDYSKAEKITKKQLKINKLNTFYYVYLGSIFKAQSEFKKETECYEKAIKEVATSAPYLQNLAAAFSNGGLYDYAIQTYLKGRKENKDYPYYYEIADLYKQKNDLKLMVNEYLDALEFRESELQVVQMNLQNNLGYDETDGGINNPILKQELQKRIQKNNEKTILVEFLIFIQKQQKDFNGAFVQSRALDKRLKEDGTRIYELAKICYSNNDFETAQKCYNYLIEKGTGSSYFDLANIELLNVEFSLIKNAASTPSAVLTQLETKYDKLINNYKNSNLGVSLIKNRSLLQAYYLNKKEQAITSLSDLIKLTGISANERAEYKLILGDIYLISGEIWESSLLYSQVEKEFKYDAIGQEAKFRNAKLSFYAGDFKWSKAQADILKGATSKLISNDALDLSLIISDAIGIDTNDLPLKLYASAELMLLQHNYQGAISRLDSINLLFSTHTLADDISLKKAQIYLNLNELSKAEMMYKNILEFYSNEIYGDDAQFKLAELYEKRNEKEKAKIEYQNLMSNFPGSIYTVEARKRYRLLRGDNVSN